MAAYEYEYYDYDEFTTISALRVEDEAVTEVWTSENQRDITDIMAKRIVFTIYIWMYRLILGIGTVLGLAILVVLPIMLWIVLMVPKMRQVLAQRRGTLMGVFERKFQAKKQRVDEDWENDRRYQRRTRRL